MMCHYSHNLIHLVFRKNRKKLGLEMEDLQEILQQMEAKSKEDPVFTPCWNARVADVKDKIDKMDNANDGVRTSLSKLLVEKEGFLESVSGKSKEEVEYRI